MSSIPNTADALLQFCVDHKDKWPPDLAVLAVLAHKALWRIENNPPHQNQALEAMGSQAWKSDLNAIVAFAEAYGAWKAKGGAA